MDRIYRRWQILANTQATVQEKLLLLLLLLSFRKCFWKTSRSGRQIELVGFVFWFLFCVLVKKLLPGDMSFQTLMINFDVGKGLLRIQ